MKRDEKRILLAGLVIGAIVAATIFIGREYIMSHETAQSAAEPAPATSDSVNDVSPISDSAVSVALTDEEQKAIGVETVEIKRQTLRKEIAAPGKVVEPETGIGAISARIGGRIDKLLLNVTGESVTRGQPVALIYSPEILTAGEEYKLSLENRQRLSASKEPHAITDADELVRASRRRLELWGLTPPQIEEIASSSEPSIQIATYSQMSGVVTKRNVAEGQYVKEGDILYMVADLSTVWVQADIFESDIPSIRNGQAVKITAPAAPGSLRGIVSFLQPAVDPQTRTMTARIQVPNPQMRLRPGMFVQVSLETSLGNDVVAVPRSAVLETGKEKVVYVAKGDGVFEKRSIEASATNDDYYAVTKGIQLGEHVVTHGNFLIDSQTRLFGSMTGMFGGAKTFGAETPAPSGTYAITLRSEPTPARGGSDGKFRVTVTGPDGKSVTDAEVQVTLLMPAMPAMGMGETRSSFKLMWNGSEYAGSGAIAMAGSWNVTVEARRAGQPLGVYRTRLDAK